jgi:putative endonuclease
MARYRKRRSYCVYILGSLSGTLYVGVTSRLDQRIFQHKQHTFASFTSKYEVDRLLYWESYDDVQKAIGREKQLKGWRRDKKIALIESVNPHWEDLSKDSRAWTKGSALSS